MPQAVSFHTGEEHSEISAENARLRFALASSGIGTWDLDVINNIVYWDDRCMELYGAENIRNPGYEAVLALIHPEDRTRVRSAVELAVKPDCNPSYDIKFRTIGHKDGTTRWIQCRGQAYFNADQKPVRFSGVAFDISTEIDAQDLARSAHILADEAILNSQRNVNLQEQVTSGINIQAKDRQLLVESESRFRSLIEEAPVATCLYVGREMKIEVANQIMLDLLGRDKGVIGKPLTIAVPELIGQPFPALLDQVYTTGKTYTAMGEKASIVRNGRTGTYYFDFTYKALRNADGEIYGVMNMAVEVTEQVIARKKLEESELFTRSVFDNSPVAKLVFIGKEMIIKSINQNMLAMLGKDNSIVGMPFFEAMPELKGTVLPELLQQVFSTGVTRYSNEEPFEVIHSGKPYLGYYNSIYKPLVNPEGDIYGIIFTRAEVSEQIIARAKITEAEESLRQAVELAQLGTWSFEITSGKMLYGLRMRKWFGFDESEEITIEDAYARVFADDQEKVAAALNNSLDPQRREIYNVEYRIRDAQNGNERILHSQGKAFFNERGIAYRVSGTAQDVTAQRKIQTALEQEVKERTAELKGLNADLITINEELNVSNQRLVHSNEELAQYAYVASHDLQEPLRKIRLFSDLLHTQLIAKGEENYLVNKIIRSSERMTMLIRDLLEFSRLLKSDRLMRPVNLSVVAEAVLNDFELSVSEKAAKVTIGVLPVIEAVNLQMNQLFYNLLGNALKFSTPGIPPVIRIDSRLISHEEVAKHLLKLLPFTTYHLITFADNGIGFAPEYKEQIFEVFKRLHGRDMYPGSGIGLALCRRIVANHQGHLYAESSPEAGTTFHIILPVKQQNIQSSLPENFTWPEK